MSTPRDIFEAIQLGQPLLLDGATGTEIERRGLPTEGPLWSTKALLDAPEVVQSIHQEHARAGAEIIVANTFRCGPRALERGGLDVKEHGQQLVARAVELARVAGRLTAASVAPVEDCYEPESVPDDTALHSEHTQLAEWIAQAGADLVWIETMNCAREAGIAAECAAATGLPFAVSFVLSEEQTLLSGEPLHAAFEAVCSMSQPPVAIGINCIPPKGATRALPRLLELAAGAIPVTVYAHISQACPIPGWSYTQDLDAAAYGEATARWIDMGARVVGGCCGTQSAHVRAMRAAIDRSRALKDPRWREST